MKTAILVDGGFYKLEALRLFGKKSPEARAAELVRYCQFHLLNRAKYEIIGDKKRYAKNDLYRVFYYDCPPVSKMIYHPLLKKNVDFSKKDTFQWTTDFFNSLRTKRKFALRLGKLADATATFNLKSDVTKKILSGARVLTDLTEKDFDLALRQKGVDMKIGIDIATLAYKRLVDQIVLISGDSDFVPVAKLARREGIDFVLDPMGTHIAPDLQEHIDGMQSYYKWMQKSETSDLDDNL